MGQVAPVAVELARRKQDSHLSVEAAVPAGRGLARGQAVAEVAAEIVVVAAE